MSEFINSLGHRVIDCDNGQKALEILKKEKIHLVLSDIRMPVMNGWELYRKIHDKYPLIDVILYSGDPSALNEKAAQEIRPEFFLRKPFKLDDLEDMIDQISRNRI